MSYNIKRTSWKENVLPHYRGSWSMGKLLTRTEDRTWLNSTFVMEPIGHGYQLSWILRAATSTPTQADCGLCVVLQVPQDKDGLVS
ncbi:hypothetical protein GH733_010769 [Mirounga leonina]|nr:hypothetical protein GH733_010769 [Mirounga leonina]